MGGRGETPTTTMFETAAEQPNPNQPDIDDGGSVDDGGSDSDEQQTLYAMIISIIVIMSSIRKDIYSILHFSYKHSPHSYSIIPEFYKSEIFSVRNKDEFEKSRKMLENKINYLSRKNAIHLELNINDIDFMDNPAYGQVGRSRETSGSVEISRYNHMEHRVMTLQLRTCKICRENKLVFDKYAITNNFDERDESLECLNEHGCCDNKYNDSGRETQNEHPPHLIRA